MIGSITTEIGGKSKTLKFSTRAQARVERELGAGIGAIMAGFESQRYGVDAVCEILAASWNDGRGADVGVAYDAIDAVGQERAFEIMGDLVKAAYPDTENTGDDAGSDEGKTAPKA